MFTVPASFFFHGLPQSKICIIIASQSVTCQVFAHNLCYYSLMKDLSEKLKTLRLDKGLTQAEVSKELGLTRNAIANYETGIREPSLEILIKICQFFNVSADYLLGLEK